MTSGSPRGLRWRLSLGAAVVVCIGVVVAGALVTAFTPTGTTSVIAPVPSTATSAPASALHESVFVHVTGAVARPGLYGLGNGARVVDAIAAAGGFSPKADRDNANLARILSDGEQLHVPREGEVVDTSGATPDGRVNVNTADVSALDTLPRVGPALAARIIAWREVNGRFAAIDDLLEVSGIGQATLDGFRDLITL